MSYTLKVIVSPNVQTFFSFEEKRVLTLRFKILASNVQNNHNFKSLYILKEKTG